MMSELEAVAVCTAVALKDADGWQKAQADKATEHAKKLLKNGEIDVDVYAKVIERCTGNHSARRQRLVSWGLVKGAENDSAEKRAIEKALEELNAKENAAIHALLAEKPKAP